MTGFRVRISIGVATTALAAASLAVLASGPAVAAPESQTFDEPGATTFDVPATICFVTISADGARAPGGDGGDGQNTPTGSGAGGGPGFSGGGGGSSFVADGATASSSAASTLDGDGEVVVSFDPVTDSCPIIAEVRFTG